MHPSRAAFWRFSFDEMGRLDLPAMLEHVLASTGRSRVAATVAHSMGATALLAAAHHLPEGYLDQRVALVVALAPAARIDHMRTPLKYLVPFQDQIEVML